MVKYINGHYFPISQCLDLACHVIVLIKNTFNYDISIDKDTSKTYKKIKCQNVSVPIPSISCPLCPLTS